MLHLRWCWHFQKGKQVGDVITTGTSELVSASFRGAASSLPAPSDHTPLSPSPWENLFHYNMCTDRRPETNNTFQLLLKYAINELWHRPWCVSLVSIFWGSARKYENCFALSCVPAAEGTFNLWANSVCPDASGFAVWWTFLGANGRQETQLRSGFIKSTQPCLCQKNCSIWWELHSSFSFLLGVAWNLNSVSLQQKASARWPRKVVVVWPIAWKHRSFSPLVTSISASREMMESLLLI